MFNISEKIQKPAYDLKELLMLVPASRSFVLQEIEKGYLKTGRVGRKLIFLSDDIAKWLEGMRQSERVPRGPHP